MRVLYFYQYFSTPKGSWGTRVYEFARRWVEAGDEVTVVTSVYDKSDLQPTKLLSTFDVEGIEVVVVNIPISNKHGALARSLTFGAFTALASWFAVSRPADIVIASSGPLSVGLLGWCAKLVRRRPFVFEMRDLFADGLRQMGIVESRIAASTLGWLEKFFCKRADLVIALSPGVVEWVRESAARTPTVLIPNAADNELFGQKIATTGLKPAGGPVSAVYAGTVGPANNCGFLLDVAQELMLRGERDIQIEIIGDGKERRKLEARVRGESIDIVRFLDLMSKNALAERLGKAALSLLVVRPIPVFDTMSPNKLFDALAAGLPVVQTTQGWIRDLLEEEGCGLTVPGDDPEAMADAIMTVVRDNELRAEMSSNARRVARERFDRGLLAEKMRQALHQVVNDSR